VAYDENRNDCQSIKYVFPLALNLRTSLGAIQCRTFVLRDNRYLQDRTVLSFVI
jgi:hypothetical protein